MRPLMVAVAVLAATTVTTETARAQFLAGPVNGREIAAIHLKAGLLAPMSTFDDPSFGETGYTHAFAAGLGVTAWPAFRNRVGVKVSLMRSQTDGESDYEYAPIVVNSPNVWLLSTELAARLPMGSGFPYISAGYGLKQYTWAVGPHKVTRDGAFTAAAGYELRPAAMGAFGINAEVRGYRSEYRAFGVDDGTWEPGPYGGKVGGVPNLDLLFTTGISLYF